MASSFEPVRQVESTREIELARTIPERPCWAAFGQAIAHATKAARVSTWRQDPLERGDAPITIRLRSGRGGLTLQHDVSLVEGSARAQIASRLETSTGHHVLQWFVMMSGFAIAFTTWATTVSHLPEGETSATIFRVGLFGVIFSIWLTRLAHRGWLQLRLRRAQRAVLDGVRRELGRADVAQTTYRGGTDATTPLSADADEEALPARGEAQPPGRAL